MMERIAALGVDYLATVMALARSEAGHDLDRVRSALKARMLAFAAIALGALWLNVALLLWLLTTPYAPVAALAIGVAALAVGLSMAAGARRRLAAVSPLAGTRRVLAAEFGAGAADGPSAPLAPAEAAARLQAIREEVIESVSLHRGPENDPMASGSGASTGFQPRSRTMRTVLWIWRAIPRVPAGAAMASSLGVLAVSSPKLRRLLAAAALLRNLGGHLRGAGSTDRGLRSPH